MAEVSVIRKLVLSLLFFMVVAGLILGTGLGDWVMDAVNFIMNLLLGDLGDDQVAKDSVQALTCAIDVAALAGPDGTAKAIDKGPASCWEGSPVGMAVAMYAPRHGPITARVIDGANRITGAAIPKNQCGPVEGCGLLDKDPCKEGERCIKKTIGWYCVPDPTCTSAGERAEAAEGAYVRCFGQNDHVCVVCEDPPPGKTVCCSYKDEYAMFRQKWVPESECHSSLVMGDDYCYETVGSKGHKFTCTIIGFELPQKVITGHPVLGPANYIAATGDPQYVVFHEKFPEAVAENWNLLGEDVAFMYIATAGAASAVLDCALPGAGKVISKAGGKVAEGGVGRLVGKYSGKAGSMAGSFRDNTIGRIFLKRGLRKAFKTSLKREFRENTGKMTGFSRSVEQIDELKAMMIRQSVKPLDDDVAKSMAIEIAGYVHVAKDAKSSAAKVKQAKGQIKKLLNDGGITADDAYVDSFIEHNVVENARHGLVSVYYTAENYILPAFETTMKKGGKSATHLDEDGIKKILTATKGSFPKKSELDNAVDEIVRAETLGDPAAKKFIESADKVMKKLGVDEADSLAKAAILSRSLKGTGFTARAVNPKTTRGKVTIAMGLGVIGAAIYDHMTGMRDPSECGTNKMCLYGREWPAGFSAGMKKQAQMSPETEKLWIELRGSEEGGPLYLASPCKADIVVEYSECECEEFYDTAKIHTDIVIQEWGLKTYPCFFGIPTLCITYDIIDTFNVPIDFPHEFKYTDGESITFEYIPECEEGKEDTPQCKPRNKELKNGDTIDSPVMLEQALRGMKRDESKDIDELEEWVRSNVNRELSKGENQFTFTHMINHNLEQGTLYKSCVKGDWWAFWKEDKDVPCVKIYAEAGYPNDYEQNFCYEKKWDSASKAEVGIFAAEIVAGVVAAALATPETLGAGALPAYCAASMGVSAAGAWVLSGTMAEDKWPNGINQ